MIIVCSPMSNMITNPSIAGAKSSDEVIITSWMNMSPDEIDAYLNYDIDSNLSQKIDIIRSKPLRRCRLAIPMMYKANDSNIYVPLNGKRKNSYKLSGPSVKIKSPGKLEYNIESLRNVRRKTNNPRVATSDINIKVGILYGCDTFSPIVASFSGKIDNKFQIPEKFRDADLLTLISTVRRELALVLELFVSGGNVFSHHMRQLRYLHTRLLSFREKGFMHFLTFIVHMMQNLINQNAKEFVPNIIIQLMYFIETSFHGTENLRQVLEEDNTAQTDGHFFLAPPGTGKTQFLAAVQLGMLDTDWFSSKLITEHPAIIDNLLHFGFSMVSNRWEYDQLKHPVVCIQSNDINRGLFMKQRVAKEKLDQFEADKRAFLSERYKERYLVKSLYAKRDASDWIKAYSQIDEVCAVIVLDTDQCFIHGFNKVLDFYISQIVAPTF